MNLIFKFMGTLFIITYLLLNYYIGLRAFQTMKAFIPPLKSFIFWPIFLLIAFAYILDRIPGFSHPLLRISGSYWIAIFFYLLIFFLLIDFFGLLNSTFSLFPSSWGLLWQSKKIYSLALILTTGILIIGSYMAQHPQVIQYDVNISKKLDTQKTMKLVMVSDLHIEAHAKTDFMEEAAQTISALNPDIILLAGDIVEGTLDPGTEEKLGRIIDQLHAPAGVYAVLGNHEYYGGQVDQITTYLEEHGIHVLRDSITTALGEQIYIAGREDYRGGYVNSGKRKPLDQILAGIDHSKPLLLLDHQPQEVKEAQRSGVDLMLSGHTHGGQLFPAQWVTKAIFVIDRGIWRDGPFHLIVSTGLGLWGPPVRTNSRSEIVEINLTFTNP